MLTIVEICSNHLNCYRFISSTTKVDVSNYDTVAQITKQQVYFGEAAKQQLKLQPTQCVVDYWQYIDQQTIATENSTIQHKADLVYQQLVTQIKPAIATHTLVLVVPEHYSDAQLALLLGVFQAAQLTVTALMPQSLWLQLVYHQQQPNVLMMQPQAAILRALQHNNQHCMLAEQHCFRDCGWQALEKSLSHWVNKLFIAQFRRDLYLTAQSEQALYHFVQQLLHQPVEQYQFSYQQQQITISAGELQQILYKFLAPLLTKLPADLSQILLEPKVAHLFQLAGVSYFISAFDQQQLVQGCNSLSVWLQQLAKQQGELQGVWLASIPSHVLAVAETSTYIKPNHGWVSHMLYQHRARPIPELGWYFSKPVNFSVIKTGNDLFGIVPKDGKLWLELIQAGSIRLNGQLVQTSQVLHVGDHLVFEEAPDQQFDFIYVEDTGIR